MSKKGAHIMVTKLAVSVLAGMIVLSWPSMNYAGVTTSLLSARIEDCPVKVEHDAVAGSPGVMLIRTRGEKPGDCDLSANQLADVIGQGMKELGGRRGLADITSIFIGRIYIYKWMSEYLGRTALNDKRWNRARRRPVAGSPNQYVNTVLNSPALLGPIMKQVEKNQYRITGVSCEKVLTDERRVPYDAMCWLKLAGVKTAH